MGRNANLSGVHRYWADNGVGQQSDRDPLGRVGALRRSVHAQEGTAAQVPLRTKRQSVLQQRQERLLVPNLLHDAEQARHGQLVTAHRSAVIPNIVARVITYYYSTYIMDGIVSLGSY